MQGLLPGAAHSQEGLLPAPAWLREAPAWCDEPLREWMQVGAGTLPVVPDPTPRPRLGHRAVCRDARRWQQGHTSLLCPHLWRCPALASESTPTDLLPLAVARACSPAAPQAQVNRTESDFPTRVGCCAGDRWPWKGSSKHRAGKTGPALLPGWPPSSGLSPPRRALGCGSRGGFARVPTLQLVLVDAEDRGLGAALGVGVWGEASPPPAPCCSGGQLHARSPGDTSATAP